MKFVYFYLLWWELKQSQWPGCGMDSEQLRSYALDICVHFCKNWFFVLSCMNFVCMNLKLVYINCRTKWRDPARTRHNTGRGKTVRTRHNPSWNRSRYSLNINHLRKLSIVYHLKAIKCIINECYSSKYNIGYLAFHRGSNHRMTRRYWFCLCRYTRIIWLIYHILKIIGLKSLYIWTILMHVSVRGGNRPPYPGGSEQTWFEVFIIESE